MYIKPQKRLLAEELAVHSKILMTYVRMTIPA